MIGAFFVYCVTAASFITTCLMFVTRILYKLTGQLPPLEFRIAHEGLVELTMLMIAVSILCLIINSNNKEEDAV